MGDADRSRIGQALAVVLGLALGAAFGPAAAQEGPVVIVIKDHRFQPAEVHVPAGKRIQLVIDNRDPTAEEFESLELRREKIVPGRSRASLWVGPLPAGEYPFFGEFHPKTAQGKLIAK